MALFKRDVHHNYYEDHEAARMREERLAEEAEEERELRKKQMEMNMAMRDYDTYKRYKRDESRRKITKVVLIILGVILFYGAMFLWLF